MANADQMAVGVTRQDAEETYRKNIAALVESGQRAVENAPILLPGGVERNAKAQQEQEKKRHAELLFLQHIQQINKQLTRILEQIAEIDEALLNLKARELEIYDELIEIADHIALLENGLDDSERAFLMAIYGPGIAHMSDPEVQKLLEDQQAKVSGELDENERQQREKEAEKEDLERRYREFERQRDSLDVNVMPLEAKEISSS